MVIAPNFLSVRLTDNDKTNFVKVAEHMQRTVGIELSQGDVYRLVLAAYAKQNNIKVIQ